MDAEATRFDDAMRSISNAYRSLCAAQVHERARRPQMANRDAAEAASHLDAARRAMALFVPIR